MIEPNESVLLIINSLEFIFFIYLIIFSQFVLHFYNSKIVFFDWDLHQSTVKKISTKNRTKKTTFEAKSVLRKIFSVRKFRWKTPPFTGNSLWDPPLYGLFICGKSLKEILTLAYFFESFLWVLWLGFELHYWIEKQNILIDLKLGILANRSCELSKDC